MNNAGFSRRFGDTTAVPAAISKRQRCQVCSRIASIGQYPQHSQTCIRCKPMPAGWRRGDLQTVQFKEVA